MTNLLIYQNNIQSFLGIFDHSGNLWMIFGAALVFLEVIIAPGLGMLFAGLAAITTGIIVISDFVSPTNYILQISIFLFLIPIWALILWKRLKELYRSGKEDDYHNLIGSKAIVWLNPLKKNQIGQVKWSGTIMNAKLDENSLVEIIETDQVVTILQASGNILIVDQ